MDKMYIELNKNSLSDLNITSEEAQILISDLADKLSLKLNNKGWYEGKFEKIGAFYAVLKKSEWVTDCIDKWYWYEEASGGILDVFMHCRYGKTVYINE